MPILSRQEIEAIKAERSMPIGLSNIDARNYGETIDNLLATVEALQSDSLDVLQAQIGKWGDQTFGDRDDGTAILWHLSEEIIELMESHEPEEAADCMLLLLQFAHRRGFNLLDVVKKKHAINQQRKWGEPDANGVVRHVKEVRPDA